MSPSKKSSFLVPRQVRFSPWSCSSELGMAHWALQKSCRIPRGSCNSLVCSAPRPLDQRTGGTITARSQLFVEHVDAVAVVFNHLEIVDDGFYVFLFFHLLVDKPRGVGNFQTPRPPISTPWERPLSGADLPSRCVKSRS